MLNIAMSCISGWTAENFEGDTRNCSRYLLLLALRKECENGGAVVRLYLIHASFIPFRILRFAPLLKCRHSSGCCSLFPSADKSGEHRAPSAPLGVVVLSNSNFQLECRSVMNSYDGHSQIYYAALQKDCEKVFRSCCAISLQGRSGKT